MSSTTRTQYGIFEERPLAASELSPALRGAANSFQSFSLLVWCPSPEIAADFFDDGSIAFEIPRDAIGNRRFVPRDDPGAFVQHCWLAGLGIQRHRLRMSADDLANHRFMKLVFDRVRAGREHLGRDFNAARDLFVRPKGRGGGIGESLLPEYVGKTSNGEGSTWSISRLTKRGREAAIDNGIDNPTNNLAICYGLTLAADINPLFEDDPEKIRALVLGALFDAGESPRQATDAEVDDVANRVSAAVEAHQDDAWDQFDAYFSGRSSNIVKSLARKAGCRVLDRKVVKAALLKLGLRSYGCVTSCLSHFAQAIRQGLAERLNEVENRQFEAMYLPQPYFGGLPLFLLLERLDLLRVVVPRLWENPEDEHLIRTLHRLFAIYGSLAPARRQADRRFKQLQRAIEPSSAQQAVKKTKKTPFVIAKEILDKRGQGCPKCQSSAKWDLSLDPRGDAGMIVTVVCGEHGFEADFVITIEELKREQFD